MTITWSYKKKGRVYTSKVVSACSLCGAFAVVELPDDIKNEQPDGTTHVCHPSAGGCNHGFANGG